MAYNTSFISNAAYDVAKGVSNAILDYLLGSTKDEVLGNTDLLHLYNTIEEDDHDCVDYLFALDNTEDVLVCLEGGMRIAELRTLLNDYEQGKHTKYFFFGTNYPTPKPLKPDQFVGVISNLCYDIAVELVKHPTRSFAHRHLYSIYVTETMNR